MPLRLEWLDKKTEEKFKAWCAAKYGINKRGIYSLGFTQIIEFFFSPEAQDLYPAWKKSRSRIVALENMRPSLFMATSDKTEGSQLKKNQSKKRLKHNQ